MKKTLIFAEEEIKVLRLEK